MKTSYLPWALIGMTALVGCSSESTTPTPYPAGTGGAYVAGQGGGTAGPIGPGTVVTPGGGAPPVGTTPVVVTPGGGAPPVGTTPVVVTPSGGSTGVVTTKGTTIIGTGGTTPIGTTAKGGAGTGGTTAKATGGAATGTGGGTPVDSGGALSTGACSEKADVISNFEDGAAAAITGAKVLPGVAITGAWEEFYNTATDGAVGTIATTIESSGGTADCDKFALHTKGSGWGGWVGVGLTNLAGTKAAPAVYPNTKTYTGISFKAKVGTGHPANSPVRVNISTPDTEGTGSGGKCTAIAKTAEKAARPCYQHMGRFLQEDFAVNSTGWTTVNLCFDRDLYPLSLPGNLTNAQRDAIAANMLKIQFQFNQAKDWTVTSYPNLGKYVDIAKTAAFDFYLDDLKFTTGECPNSKTFASSAGTTKTFPQNRTWGTCAPATGAAKFNAAITSAYARWKKIFVKSDGSIVSPEQAGIITSEAMGYGMMIAAAMGDKEQFDKFWAYVQTHLSGGLMTWSNTGSGSATDGDTDIAYGLAMAAYQWPTGAYGAAATTMAAAILASDVQSGKTLKGGSQWMDRFNPSYFSPVALRKFGNFAAVITEGYRLVNANIAAATAGIPTDWADPASGAPADKGSAQVTSELAGIAYGYDAARVPWRIGMDVCNGATEGASSIATIISFFSTKYDAGASIDLLKAGWTKGTGVVDPNAKDMQGSFIGPMGVAGMAANNAALRDRSFRAILDILDYGDFNHTYFPSTVGILTALAMSGNFPTP